MGGIHQGANIHDSMLDCLDGTTCLACLRNKNWQGRGWWDSAGEAEIISAWFWVTNGYLQHLAAFKQGLQYIWVHMGALSLCDGKATKDSWLLWGQSWGADISSILQSYCYQDTWLLPILDMFSLRLKGLFRFWLWFNSPTGTCHVEGALGPSPATRPRQLLKRASKVTAACIGFCCPRHVRTILPSNDPTATDVKAGGVFFWQDSRDGLLVDINYQRWLLFSEMQAVIIHCHGMNSHVNGRSESLRCSCFEISPVLWTTPSWIVQYASLVFCIFQCLGECVEVSLFWNCLPGFYPRTYFVFIVSLFLGAFFSVQILLHHRNWGGEFLPRVAKEGQLVGSYDGRWQATFSIFNSTLLPGFAVFAVDIMGLGHTNTSFWVIQYSE